MLAQLLNRLLSRGPASASPVAEGGTAANVAGASDDLREFTAYNDFRADEKGWFQVSPFGRFPHSKGLQIVERSDAETIVSAFNSFRSVGKRYFGLPFYRGHPDAAPKDYPDDRAYGRIKELEVRADGLYGRAEFSANGKELINEGAYDGHSPYWRFTRQGTSIRPVELISVGFTNQPNIQVNPITAANEDRMNEFLKKLAKLLGLGEAANEAEIEIKATAIQAAANELPGVKTKLVEAEGRITALSNDLSAANGKATKAENDLIAANARVTTITGERDTMKGERDTAANALKTERTERTKIILDTAINSATITAAERPGIEGELSAAKDDAAYNAVAKRVVEKVTTVLHTKSRSQGRVAAGGKGSSDWTAFNSKREELMAKAVANGKPKGMAYNEAQAQCERMPEFKHLVEDAAA